MRRIKDAIQLRVVGFFILGAVLLTGGYGGSQFFANLTRYQEYERALIDSLRQSVRWQIVNADETIQYLVEQCNQKSGSIQEELSTAFRINSYFESLHILNTDGKALFSEPSENFRLEDYSSFLKDNISSPMLFSDISIPYVNRRTGTVTVNFLQHTKFGNYIMGQVDLSFLQEIVQDAVEGSSQTRIVLITDSYGNILAHPEERLVQEQANIGGQEWERILDGSGDASPVIAQILGQRAHVLSTRIPGTDWYLLHADPLGLLLLDLGRSLVGILGLMLLLILFWGLHIGTVLRQIVVDPLYSFVDVVQKSAMADRPLPIKGTISNYREFVKLQNAFNSLAYKIKARDRELQKYQKAVQEAGFAIYITDSDGVIEYINPAFERITGFSFDETIGKTPKIMSSGEMGQEYFDRLWKVLDNKRIWEEEIINRRKDGSLYYAHQTIAPILNHEGKVSNYVAIQSDITARKKDAQRLKESEQLYRSLFQLAADAIMLVDPKDGSIKEFNHTAHEKLGYTAEEFKKLKISDIEGEESPEETAEHIKEILKTGFGSFESLHKTKEGELRIVLVNVSVLTMGNSPYLLSISHDITERKSSEERLRRSEEMYRLITENSTDMISKHSPEGIYTYVSPACRSLLGYEAYELLNTSAYDYFHPEDLQKIDSAHESARKGQKVSSVIYRIRKKDGSYTWFETTSRMLVPETDDINPEIVAISRDVSYRKKIEDEMRRAKEQAEAASRAKSEFIANISHEIRTPMNAVLGYTQLLSETVPAGEARQYIQSIENSGQILLSLINDILDISRIEAGHLSLEYGYTDVLSIVKEIEEVFRISMHEKQLEFSLEAVDDFPREILLDESRLRQVILNLVGNAVKFTEKGSIQIRLTADTSIENSERVDLSIQVADTGIGIRQNQLERIFESFQQQEGQSTRKFGGTGLGLSISKRLIEAMGGRISVSSIVGEGSVFTVEIPAVEILRLNGPESEASENSASESMTEAQKLSDLEMNLQPLENPEELLQELKSVFIPRWQELRHTMFLDDLQGFAGDLKKLAENRQAEGLLLFARQLEDAAVQFNIGELDILMDRFPRLIDSLEDA